MDPAEYLAFVPLLIYGLGLADLFSEWKRFLSKEAFYWPYAITTLILTETGIYNVFIYSELVNRFPGTPYLDYLIDLSLPVVFILITEAFTPDKGEETEKAFQKRKSTVFPLFAVFIGCHFLYAFNEFSYTYLIRIGAILSCLFIAYSKKNWAIYLLLAQWVILFILRINFNSLP